MNKKFWLVAVNCIVILLWLIFSLGKHWQRSGVDKAPQSVNEPGQKIPDPPREFSQDPSKARFERNFGHFTKEEIAAKPFWVSWRQYSEFIAVHRSGQSTESEIEFYGRVIDTTGAPLAGVVLQAEIRYTPSLKEAITAESALERTKILDLETDAEGLP